MFEVVGPKRSGKANAKVNRIPFVIIKASEVYPRNKLIDFRRANEGGQKCKSYLKTIEKETGRERIS